MAILDADKAGFLRSETSLIQTIGRAARNVNAKVILYADKITPAMQTGDGRNRPPANAAAGVQPAARHHAADDQEGDPHRHRIGSESPAHRAAGDQGRRAGAGSDRDHQAAGRGDARSRPGIWNSNARPSCATRSTRSKACRRSRAAPACRSARTATIPRPKSGNPRARADQRSASRSDGSGIFGAPRLAAIANRCAVFEMTNNAGRYRHLTHHQTKNAARRASLRIPPNAHRFAMAANQFCASIGFSAI